MLTKGRVLWPIMEKQIMMNNISVLMVIPLIVMFWVLLKVLFPNMIKDYFREYLFSLRNEMFNYSNEHNTELFSTPIYRDIESLINSTIQYTEKIKPSIMVAIFFKTKKEMFEELSRQKDSMQKQFEKNIGKITNPEDAKYFRFVRSKLEKGLGMYFLLSSWTMVVVSITVIIIILISVIVASIFSIVFKSISKLQKDIESNIKQNILSNIRIVEVSACLDNR
jgi:hypothetical protein